MMFESRSRQHSRQRFAEATAHRKLHQFPVTVYTFWLGRLAMTRPPQDGVEFVSKPSMARSALVIDNLGSKALKIVLRAIGDRAEDTLDDFSVHGSLRFTSNSGFGASCDRFLRYRGPGTRSALAPHEQIAPPPVLPLGTNDVPPLSK